MAFQSESFVEETIFSFRYKGHIHLNGDWDFDGIKIPSDLIATVQTPEDLCRPGDRVVILSQNVIICENPVECGGRDSIIIRCNQRHYLIPTERIDWICKESRTKVTFHHTCTPLSQ